MMSMLSLSETLLNKEKHHRALGSHFLLETLMFHRPSEEENMSEIVSLLSHNDLIKRSHRFKPR